MICDICGIEEYLPFTCSRCGGKFCSKHRLPERHQCTNIPTRKTSLWIKTSHREIAREIARSRILEKEREYERKVRLNTSVTHDPKPSSHDTKSSSSKYLIVLILIIGVFVGVYITTFKDVSTKVTSINIVYPEPFLSGDKFDVHVSMNKTSPTYLQNILNKLFSREENITVRVDGDPIIVDKITLGFNENTSRVYSILEKIPGTHTITISNISKEFVVPNSTKFITTIVDPQNYWLGQHTNTTVYIKNVGGIKQSRPLICYLDGEKIRETQITLEPEQYMEEIFHFLTDVSGKHTLMFCIPNCSNTTSEFETKVVRFDVQNFNLVPNDPWVGERVNITIQLRNIDGYPDIKTISCYIDNNEVVTYSVSLDPYLQRSLSFSYDIVTTGSHYVSINWETESVTSETIETFYVENILTPTDRPEYYYTIAEIYVNEEYDVPNNKDIVGLTMFLDQIEFPEYNISVFDCSESSSLLEWLLEGAGFHTWVVSTNTHAWVQVQTDNGVVALEATQLTHGWGHDDYLNIKPWGIVSRSDGLFEEYTYQYRYNYQRFLDWKEKYASSKYVWDRQITFEEWMDEWLLSMTTIVFGIPSKSGYYDTSKAYESPIPHVKNNIRYFSTSEYDWWNTKPYSTIFPFSEW